MASPQADVQHLNGLDFLQDRGSPGLHLLPYGSAIADGRREATAPGPQCVLER